MSHSVIKQRMVELARKYSHLFWSISIIWIYLHPLIQVGELFWLFPHFWIWKQVSLRNQFNTPFPSFFGFGFTDVVQNSSTISSTPESASFHNNSISIYLIVRSLFHGSIQLLNKGKESISSGMSNKYALIKFYTSQQLVSVRKRVYTQPALISVGRIYLTCRFRECRPTLTTLEADIGDDQARGQQECLLYPRTEETFPQI